jgi:hypothetical protein
LLHKPKTSYILKWREYFAKEEYITAVCTQAQNTHHASKFNRLLQSIKPRVVSGQSKGAVIFVASYVKKNRKFSQLSR